MSLWSYQAPPELSDEQFCRWQDLLEQRTGISFHQHKSIMQKGLSQRMRDAGFEDYETYFDYVNDSLEGVVEWMRLVDQLSVKETSFFREPESYNLVRNFLSERFEGPLAANTTLDMWSVGCATGEEAYSLAMVGRDIIDFLAKDIFLGVVGTDISPTALMIARQGNYASRKLDTIPVAIKNKHFIAAKNNRFDVSPELKQQVCFVQGNIIELDRSPKMNMDVVFCQNVLVYFNRDLQKRVLDSLVRHVKPGGLMVIGPGEVTGWQHPQMQRCSDDMVQAYIRRVKPNKRSTKQ